MSATSHSKSSRETLGRIVAGCGPLPDNNRHERRCHHPRLCSGPSLRFLSLSPETRSEIEQV